MDFLKLLMEQIESYQQCDVYNIIHIDVWFEIRKSKTQIDKQVEKKIYAHNTDSRRQASREARNCCGLLRCLLLAVPIRFPPIPIPRFPDSRFPRFPESVYFSLPRFFQQGWLAQPSPTTLSPFDPTSYSL